VIYAIILELRSEQMTIHALRLSVATSPGRVEKLEVPGAQEAPAWKQTANGLTVTLHKRILGIPEYGVTLTAQLA